MEAGSRRTVLLTSNMVSNSPKVMLRRHNTTNTVRFNLRDPTVASRRMASHSTNSILRRRYVPLTGSLILTSVSELNLMICSLNPRIIMDNQITTPPPTDPLHTSLSHNNQITDRNRHTVPTHILPLPRNKVTILLHTKASRGDNTRQAPMDRTARKDSARP